MHPVKKKLGATLPSALFIPRDMDPTAGTEEEAAPLDDGDDLAAMAAVEAELLAMADQEDAAPDAISPQHGDSDVEQAMAELAGMIDVQANAEIEADGAEDQCDPEPSSTDFKPGGDGRQTAGSSRPAGVHHQLSAEEDLPTVDHDDEEDIIKGAVLIPSPRKPSTKTLALNSVASAKHTKVSSSAIPPTSTGAVQPAFKMPNPAHDSDTAVRPSEVLSKKRPGLVVARVAAPKSLQVKASVDTSGEEEKGKEAKLVPIGATAAGKKVSNLTTKAAQPAAVKTISKPVVAASRTNNKPSTASHPDTPLPLSITTADATHTPKDYASQDAEEHVKASLPLVKKQALKTAAASAAAKNATASNKGAITETEAKQTPAIKKIAASSDANPKVLGSVTKPSSKPNVIAVDGSKPASSKAVKPSAKVTPAFKPASREQGDQPETNGTVAAKRKHKESAGPVLQSAYMIFATTQRPVIKEANPDASFGELGKLMGEAWKELCSEEKQAFQDQAEERKAAAAEEKAALGDAAFSEKYAKKIRKGDKDNKDPEPANRKGAKKSIKQQADQADAQETEGADTVQDKPKARTKGTGRKMGGKRKRGAPLAEVEAEADTEGTDNDDQEDRENVDWVANPATAIITHTYDGFYLIAREGLDHTNYGAVTIKNAKRLRLDPEADDMSSFPLSLKQLEDYEAGQRKFANAVKEHTEGGELDLETLPDYSVLEMCRVLGALREDKHVLDKASSKKHNKKDVFISVPLLALSEVVQRFVNIERAGKQEAVEKLAVAEAEIVTLRSQLEEPPEDDVMV